MTATSRFTTPGSCRSPRTTAINPGHAAPIVRRRKGKWHDSGDNDAAAGCAAVVATAIAVAAIATEAAAVTPVAAGAAGARGGGLHAEERGAAEVRGGRRRARLDLAGDRGCLGDRDGKRLGLCWRLPILWLIAGGGWGGGGGGGGVHADDLPVGVNQRPAGIARLDASAVADQPGQLLSGAR